MKEKFLSGLVAVAGLLVFLMPAGDVFDISGGKPFLDSGLSGPSPAYADEQNSSPYGSSKGTYGEKQQVATKDDARKLLKEYFSKRDVTVGEIREKQYYFEADILDRSGKLVDKVIVDKRTGRIRSIY